MQETFLRWQAADVDRIEVARGVADEGPHQPVPQPAHLGAGPPRDLRGPVASRAAARRGPDARPGRHRRAARIGLVRGPHPHGAPVPQRAGGVRAAGGLRLPAPGDRRDPRHHRGRQPADLPPRQEARRGRQGPHRDRRGRRPADRRGVPRGRHQRPDRAAGAPAHRGRRSRSATAAGRSRPAPRRSRAPSRSRSSCGACSSPARPSAPSSAARPRSTPGPPTANPPSWPSWTAGSSASCAWRSPPRASPPFRTQVNPDKLERATAQWAAADHGEPLFTSSDAV